MIQPLPSRKKEWLLYSVDINEPVATPEGVILPVFLVLADGRGVPITPPDVLAELNQRRAEALVRKTLEENNAPERLVVAEHPDWETDAWKDFAEAVGLQVRIRKLEVEGMVGVVENPIRPQGLDVEDTRRELAVGLLESSRRLRSERRRLDYLRKAIDLDPELGAARIEIADAEFASGKWKACLSHCDKILSQPLCKPSAEGWWVDKSTRPQLRARYLKSMVAWHRGNYTEAASHLESLLELNPTDHQGVRFLLPMLYILDGRLDDAASFFKHYEKNYVGDFCDPAFFFGWGYLLYATGNEGSAREKYIRGMLKNIYIAPMLLDIPEPPAPDWHPTERAEPSYAAEFIDSFGPIWERDSGSLRFVREIWEEIQPCILRICAKRAEILDYQDQRYDKDYRKNWERLLREEEALSEFCLTLPGSPDTLKEE